MTQETHRRVIFDHLIGAPPDQIRRFSAAPREMPEWVEQAPVAGEIVR